MKKLKFFLKSSSFRHSGIATVVIAVFLILIILINIVSGIAVDRFDLKIDLTSSNLFALSDETLSMLEKIKAPITVSVLSSEAEFSSYNDYFAQANETIKLFSKHNPNISLKYVDAIKDPTVLQKYAQYNAEPRDIIVESDIRTIHVAYTELFNLNFDGANSTLVIASSKAEYTMATAIYGVVVEKQPSVTVLSGHGESSTDDLSSYLASNNFLVDSADLTTSGIPEKSDVIVISNPSRDFTEDDLRKLDAFLFNDGKYGRNLVYFASNKQPSLPNLEAFLSEWGISIEKTTLLETNAQKIYNYNYYFAQLAYTDKTIAGPLAATGVYPAILQSRGLSIKNESSYQTTVLLSMSGTAVKIPSDSGSEIDVSKYEKSAWPAVIMGTKETTDAKSNVVVFGSNNFVDASLLKNSSVTNGDYIINLFNSLTSRGDVVPMTVKTLGGTYYSITSGQSNFLIILFIGVVPLIVLICGVYVWIRRRHL